MDLLLKRTECTPDGIYSLLTTMDGEQVAVTIEHSYDCLPKLPPGLYTCVRGIHQLHNKVPFETFEITEVPRHTGILFHVGNSNIDSEGCVLLGSQKMGYQVVKSRETFEKFMELQKGCNSFLLAVQDKGI